MNRQRFMYVIEMVILGLFLYAGVQKIMFPEALTNSLIKASYMTTGIIPVLAIAVPLVEIVTFLLLLFKHGKPAGMALALFLMMTFTIHLLLLYYFSPGTPCSCGGLFRFMNFPVHLVFNAGIIVLIVVWLTVKDADEYENIH
jgi:hypothetical protein